MTDEVVITEEVVRDYSSNNDIIDFLKSKLKRLSTKGAINLIRMLLWRQFPIKIQDITKNYKGLLQYNLTRFDDKKELKKEFIIELNRELNGFLLEIGKDLPIEERKGKESIKLDKFTTYEKIRKYTCDELGKTNFHYDFENPDMEPAVPGNKDTLQRCMIQILSHEVKFDYPLCFKYSCPQCGGKTSMLAYQTASTNNRIKCPNMYSYLNGEGEPRTRVCGLGLAPDNEISNTKDGYYFDISYDDEDGTKRPAGAISFNKYKPGFYECVLFKIKNPNKLGLYQIMDVKPIESNTIELPEKVENENYIFTLQKTFDKYIEEYANFKLYGLIPIKVSLILQKAMCEIGLRLIGNAQLVGDASTGKSTVLKYYGFLLNNHLNLSTNGLSVSVAGLRGTKSSITLMGKEVSINTQGYLGTYKTIHIDESGENKILTQNLKTFLLEDNYGYDKAGATGVFHKRTSHINISENLDYTHLGQYRGSIKKAYKELDVKIGDEEKPQWDENWDLHLPIFMYTNPYLHKVIMEKRIELQKKQLWWIDGYDYALHERFPFYFYLVNEKKDKNFIQAVKDNAASKPISENLELMRALKCDDIDEFFVSLKEYVKGKNDSDSFDKVDEILQQYGLHTDARIRNFYYNLVKVSRIINKRYTIEEEDYNLLKFILEKTNCKLDVSDTVSYKIEGAPDLEKTKEIEEQIMEETKIEDEFGIQGGEFD